MNIIDKIESLKKLKNPPKQLFYKGRLDFLEKQKIAIVGSRKMSLYTKELTISLSKALAKRGIIIVSGAAIGVDTEAQKAAYPNTIAVLANGFGELYPKQNENFIKSLYETSLVLTEYEEDFKVTKYSFVQRNRIVVALSQALIITQADKKSGSMQSAKIALDLNIPIFVLPQKLHESAGTNKLLEEGKAKLICDFEAFAASFFKEKTLFDEESLQSFEEEDEILAFLSKSDDLKQALENFGDDIYEYELEGKVRIKGQRIYKN